MTESDKCDSNDLPTNQGVKESKKQIKANSLYAILLRFDALNNEYGKLHKSIFFFSFKRKNLNYESLKEQTYQLFESLKIFLTLFEIVCPAQQELHQPLINVIQAEIVAVTAL